MAENGDKSSIIGIIGAGTMGIGIARLASANRHRVLLYDSYPDQLGDAKHYLRKELQEQVTEGYIGQQQVNELIDRIQFSEDLTGFGNCKFVIEAVTDDAEIKKDALKRAEAIVPRNCLLATTTSTLSIADFSSVLKRPGRFAGLHFLHPAYRVPLVEVIPGLLTDDETVGKAVELLTSGDKKTIRPKDTPCFLFNRITRPYFCEAFRMLEENIADPPTIDWAMKKVGGFETGPFELMDQIGHDINYRVTKSIFEGLYYDPRYTPSITQKRMVETDLLGKKAGKGFYEYGNNVTLPQPTKNKALGNEIFQRVLAMLINGAAEALWKGIGTADEIELAAIYGARYPKGLLFWCDEVGVQKILNQLESLQSTYSQERYRPSPLIKRMAQNTEMYSEEFSGI